MDTKPNYIHNCETHNLNAPNAVVPLLIKLFDPQSVLDVGCGIGTWLKVFNDYKVKDIIGIDGNYIDRRLLHEYIKPNQFYSIDLTEEFDLRKKFDLVISLEVAEHLPDSSASIFVESLSKHGDIILFSAAIPNQGGQNHLNEQWKEYWIDKFRILKYKAYDLMRPQIWNNENVDWWYKQNMLVFSKEDLSHHIIGQDIILEAVHPQLFQKYVDYTIYLQDYVKELETKLFSK